MPPPFFVMKDELFPYRLTRLAGRISQLWLGQIRARGLTMGRWQGLCVLSRFDGSRVGVIAEHSGTEQPAVSRVIDQMERDGLVERRPARDDSRAVEVWITTEGHATFEELLPEANGFVEGLLRNFSRSEIDAMTGYLDRLFGDLRDGMPGADR